MRHGETKISFLIYDPNPTDEKKGELLEELFEIPIPEDMIIREMKETLSVKLKEEKKIDKDAGAKAEKDAKEKELKEKEVAAASAALKDGAKEGCERREKGR